MIFMVRTLYSALFFVLATMGRHGDVLSQAGNSTTKNQVSSLGYPCHMEEFEKAGFVPEWSSECNGEHELIFLHVPKTAGSSIEAALSLKKNHTPAGYRKQSMELRTWDCALKFSVARNPWTRWESWYSFCLSGYGVERKLPGPQWACQMARSMTLSSWTENMILLLRGLQTLSPDLKFKLTHGGEFSAAWYFASQSEYVTDGINLEVRLPNYIISFENLESDFNCMMSLLNISVELQHKNPTILSEGVPVVERVAAFDQETRELIGEYNNFEIEQYGYEFPV